jgi:hypothetical protein
VRQHTHVAIGCMEDMDQVGLNFWTDEARIVLVTVMGRTLRDLTNHLPFASCLLPLASCWWPYPLLTQTNGYFLKKATLRGKHRKLSPPLIINYLAQSVNDRGGSLRLKRSNWPQNTEQEPRCMN